MEPLMTDEQKLQALLDACAQSDNTVLTAPRRATTATPTPKSVLELGANSALIGRVLEKLRSISRIQQEAIVRSTAEYLYSSRSEEDTVEIVKAVLDDSPDVIDRIEQELTEKAKK
jgi:hypothetical protein